MSYSSLYGIMRNYTAEEICNYKNSWLFSPIVWNILPDKYIPEEIKTHYGYKKSIISDSTGEIWKKVNRKVNACENTPDRICWEISNQQIFFTKDKGLISDSIKEFVEQNVIYGKSEKDGIYPLKAEHIKERFLEIAKDIEELDEKEYPYFVFKNSSVDDGVERWFYKYDEKTEDYEESNLSELKENVTEFVVIEDGKIKDFISNTDFKY